MVRQRMSVFSSAILSNRRLVEQLNAAEESSRDSEVDEEEPNLDETALSSNEESDATAFRRDCALAIASAPAIGPASQNVSREIFQEYENRQHDPPASAAIYSLLPDTVVKAQLKINSI